MAHQPGPSTLQFAFEEATRRGTGLLVVSAFELPDVWSIAYALPVSCSVDEIRDSVLRNTRRLVTETLGDPMTAEGAPKVDVVALGGAAAHVLVSAAAGSALLVVGSRGLAGAPAAIL